VEQSEQHLQRIVVRRRIRAQEEDLRIQLLERELELVRIRHPHHALDPELLRLVPDVHIRGDDDRVGSNPPGTLGLPYEKQRELRRASHISGIRSDDQGVGAVHFRSPGFVPVRDLDEHGDSVALGNRLAEPAHRSGCYSANSRLGATSTVDAMRRVLVVLALLGLVLAGSAVARTIQGTDRNDRLVGTPRADAIFGRGGSDQILGLVGGDLLSGGAGRDVIDGGPGNDRIVAQYDGGRDRVLCGGGLDVVDADQLDKVASDCELVSRRLSRDPYTDPAGQHETEVEPDSLTVGHTTVVAFQVGRRLDGAANNVGFAVSNDDGRTWRSGLLPGLTGASVPAGTNVRATDPAVASG